MPSTRPGKLLPRKLTFPFSPQIFSGLENYQGVYFINMEPIGRRVEERGREREVGICKGKGLIFSQFNLWNMKQQDLNIVLQLYRYHTIFTNSFCFLFSVINVFNIYLKVAHGSVCPSGGLSWPQEILAQKAFKISGKQRETRDD